MNIWTGWFISWHSKWTFWSSSKELWLQSTWIKGRQQISWSKTAWKIVIWLLHSRCSFTSTFLLSGILFCSIFISSYVPILVAFAVHEPVSPTDSLETWVYCLDTLRTLPTEEVANCLLGTSWTQMLCCCVVTSVVRCIYAHISLLWQWAPTILSAERSLWGPDSSLDVHPDGLTCPVAGAVLGMDHQDGPIPL